MLALDIFADSNFTKEFDFLTLLIELLVDFLDFLAD